LENFSPEVNIKFLGSGVKVLKNQALTVAVESSALLFRIWRASGSL